MPASDVVPGALSVGRASAAAALAGCACMVVELSAVRLLAPFFGDSAYVWTNVIGVILLALALGAWAGGRFAERSGSAVASRLLVLAAIVLCLVPFIGPAVGDWLLHGEHFVRFVTPTSKSIAQGSLDYYIDDPRFGTEDPDLLRKILGQQYHAVVGNPPYITVKDKSVSDEYRKLYHSCHRQYALVCPFTRHASSSQVSLPNLTAAAPPIFSASS